MILTLAASPRMTFKPNLVRRAKLIITLLIVLEASRFAAPDRTIIDGFIHESRRS